MAAFAQLERDTMIERTRAGLGAAKASRINTGLHTGSWLLPQSDSSAHWVGRRCAV